MIKHALVVDHLVCHNQEALVSIGVEVSFLSDELLVKKLRHPCHLRAIRLMESNCQHKFDNFKITQICIMLTELIKLKMIDITEFWVYFVCSFLMCSVVCIGKDIV